jgi:hypothetical protein
VLVALSFHEYKTCGVVAQLGERLNGIQEAASSILASSTNKIEGLTEIVSPFFLFRMIRKNLEMFLFPATPYLTYPIRKRNIISDSSAV